MKNDRDEDKNKVKGIFSKISLIYFLFGFIWLILSVAIYNICSLLLSSNILPDFIVSVLPEMQNILINLIKFVITPCFLLSFMVYLVYWILCFIQWHKNLKCKSDVTEVDITCDDKISGLHNKDEEHNMH